MEQTKLKQKPRINLVIVRDWLQFLTVVVFLFAVVYFVLHYIPYFANRRQFVVLTDSMQPTINVGDLVIINTDYPLDNLNEGDIIAFYADLNEDGTNEVVVHYIAQITLNLENERIFLTHREGVTSPSSWDQWQITDGGVIGKFDFKMKSVGRFLLFLESWFGKAVIIMDIIVLSLIYDYIKNSIAQEKLDKKLMEEKQKNCKTKFRYQMKQIKPLRKQKSKVKRLKRRKQHEAFKKIYHIIDCSIFSTVF